MPDYSGISKDRDIYGELGWIPNFNVKNVFGSQIKGPFKWVIFFLGPHNQAKEVRQMIADSEEYGLNLNIIIILITNQKERI